MKQNPFYFEIRDIIEQFINALDGCVVKRYNQDRQIQDYIAVQYKYAPKDRVLSDLINKAQHIKLPACAVNITGVQRDPGRVFNKLYGFNSPTGTITSGKGAKTAYVSQPVPIDITVQVSFLATKQSDVDQIISSFVPYSDPYFVISWKVPAEFGTNDTAINSPVIWDGNLSWNYPTDLQANQPYRVGVDTTFTIKTWLFKKHQAPSENIYYVDASITPVDSLQDMNYNENTSFISISARPQISNVFLNKSLSQQTGYTQVSIFGDMFSWTTGVYLSGTFTDPLSVIDLYSGSHNLSALYPPFNAIPASQFTVVSNNKLSVTFPCCSSGYVVYVTNPAGYDIVPFDGMNTYNAPYTPGASYPSVSSLDTRIVYISACVDNANNSFYKLKQDIDALSAYDAYLLGLIGDGTDLGPITEQVNILNSQLTSLSTYTHSEIDAINLQLVDVTNNIQLLSSAVGIAQQDILWLTTNLSLSTTNLISLIDTSNYSLSVEFTNLIGSAIIQANSYTDNSVYTLSTNLLDVIELSTNNLLDIIDVEVYNLSAEFVSTIGSAITQVNGYTDSSISSLSTELLDVIDSETHSLSVEFTGLIGSAVTQANSYTDWQTSEAYTDNVNYTDHQIYLLSGNVVDVISLSTQTLSSILGAQIIDENIRATGAEILLTSSLTSTQLDLYTLSTYVYTISSGGGSTDVTGLCAAIATLSTYALSADLAQEIVDRIYSDSLMSVSINTVSAELYTLSTYVYTMTATGGSSTNVLGLCAAVATLSTYALSSELSQEIYDRDTGDDILQSQVTSISSDLYTLSTYVYTISSGDGTTDVAGLCASVASLSTSPVTLTNGLVAFVPLDETSGTRYDVYGGMNFIDYNSCSYIVPGKTRSAALYITTNNNTLQTLSSEGAKIVTDYTISTWVYLTQKNLNQSFISRYDPANSARSIIIQYSQSQDRLAVGHSTDGSSGAVVNAYANTLGSPALSTWYWICGRYSSADSKLYISVNGGTEDSQAVSARAYYTPRTPFTIGGTGNGTSRGSQMSGYMQDVGIWNRSLSSYEIAQLYNQGAGLTYPFTTQANVTQTGNSLITPVSAVTFYVATTGLDTNNGLTVNTPISGLGRLQQLMSSYSPIITSYSNFPIVVRFANGVYNYGDWDSSLAQSYITTNGQRAFFLGNPVSPSAVQIPALYFAYSIVSLFDISFSSLYATNNAILTVGSTTLSTFINPNIICQCPYLSSILSFSSNIYSNFNSMVFIQSNIVLQPHTFGTWANRRFISAVRKSSILFTGGLNIKALSGYHGFSDQCLLVGDVSNIGFGSFSTATTWTRQTGANADSVGRKFQVQTGSIVYNGTSTSSPFGLNAGVTSTGGTYNNGE